MDNSRRSLVIEQEWDTLNESNYIADDHTSSEDQCHGVSDAQKGVINEALQHGCIQIVNRRQILRCYSSPTDQCWEALSHQQSFE